MMSPTTKPDSLQPAADRACDLFDNWFDPLEAEVRARSREFIEELLRGELEAALNIFCRRMSAAPRRSSCGTVAA